MKKTKEIFEKIKDRLDHRYDHFYILDFGRFSIKAALMELDKKEKKACILDVVEASYPNLKIFPERKNCDLTEITHLIKDLFNKFKKPEHKIKKKTLIIGLSSELVGGYNFSQVYTRENQSTPIDLREIENIIHNLELRAYENIRKKFVIESGYAETEVILINPIIQKFQLDGQNISEPIGEKGKEIFISIFNAYAPIFYKNAIEQIARDLKFNLYKIIYTPYAVFSTLKRQTKNELQGLIIDIGGGTTRITLVRKGRIEDIRHFSFGGISFTKRLASHLNVSEHEAENIKIKYSDKKVSTSVKKIIDHIIRREVDLFLKGLELALKDFSPTTLLPEQIYLYGGGRNDAVIDGIIKKRKWKKDLSFSRSPNLNFIKPEDSNRVNFSNILIADFRLVDIAAIADSVVEDFEQNTTVIEKTLSRINNLLIK